MKTKSLINFRKIIPFGIILSLLLLSTSIQFTIAAPTIKNTLIWEHYFTDMSNPYDMVVGMVAFAPEIDKLIVSLGYLNGTAIYCLNAQTGEIQWRLDPFLTYNASKYLILASPITISTKNSFNAVYIGGEGINADNFSSQEIPNWYESYKGVYFGFVMKLDINTGEIMWLNTNCSTATSKIEMGHFKNSNKLDIATITPEGIIVIDEETGTNLWKYDVSKSVASYFSYLFTVESQSLNYSDLIVCFSDTNPRAIKLSGKNGTLLWVYDDSAQPNSYYTTRDAIVGDITNDSVSDLIFCLPEHTQAINGSDGNLLWQTASPVAFSYFVSNIAIGDLYSNGSNVIVGTALEQLFFLDGITGKILKQVIIEEDYISGYVFLEDINTDGNVEILVSSFGSIIAILDASGQKLHYINGEGVLSDIIVADVLGSADKEIIAGTVTKGWIGVLGHGLSSGMDFFFPLVVIGSSLGLLGLLGGILWWQKRHRR